MQNIMTCPLDDYNLFEPEDDTEALAAMVAREFERLGGLEDAIQHEIIHGNGDDEPLFDSQLVEDSVDFAFLIYSKTHGDGYDYDWGKAKNAALAEVRRYFSSPTHLKALEEDYYDTALEVIPHVLEAASVHLIEWWRARNDNF